MDTSPKVPDQPHDPQGSQDPQNSDPQNSDSQGPDVQSADSRSSNPQVPDSPSANPRRSSRTPLIAGAAVLAVAMIGGALYWAVPRLGSEPEPEPVAVEEPRAPYAGDYLLGEPSWHLDTSRLGREISDVWSERVDDVEFSLQVASGDFDPGLEFLALEEPVKAPKNDSDYYNDVVLTHNTWYTLLREGDLEPEEGEPLQAPEDVRVLGNLVPYSLQYIVSADSDIHTLDDLAGASMVFSWGDEDVWELSDLTLLAAGVDPFSMEVHLDVWDPEDHLIEGNADVFLSQGRLPNGELEHFERNGYEVRVLEIPEAVVEKMSQIDPSYTNLTVEAGTLPGLDEDFNIMASWETLYAYADLDEELVHELVRTVYENLAEEAPHERVTSVENALNGVDPKDVHPGAARYFREQGLL